MSIFNFGNRQRLHTQMYGTTTGKEMFKIDEYNQAKKTTALLVSYLVFCFILLYFGIGTILSTKVLILFILTMIGALTWGYFNFKNQHRLKEHLYN